MYVVVYMSLCVCGSGGGGGRYRGHSGEERTCEENEENQFFLFFSFFLHFPPVQTNVLQDVWAELVTE